MISVRARSAAVLVSILVLGILAGIMIGGRIFSKRIENLRMMGRADHIKHVMMNNLSLDHQQVAELDSIFDVYSRETSRLIGEHRILIRSQVDSLMSELRIHLNDDQQDQLEEIMGEMHRRQHRLNDRKGMGGPDHRGFAPDKRPRKQRNHRNMQSGDGE
jgi:hypothetical protein